MRLSPSFKMTNIYSVRARKICNKCFKPKDRPGHICKRWFLEGTLKGRLKRVMEIHKLKNEFEKELPEMFAKAKKELEEENDK